MPNGESKRRVLSYEAQIAALGLLRHRKSEIATKAALWRNVYLAQLDVARQERKVADMDRAMRDIVIVAVTGAFACFGSFVVTSLLARSAGVAYTSGSMAAPMGWSATAVALPTGTTITVAGLQPVALTAKQWIASQVVQTIVIRIPVGAFLTRTVGSSALERFFELLSGRLSAVKYSDAEFQDMRRVLAESGVGSERYRLVMRDPAARRDALLPAIADALREMVAQYIGEALMGVDAPVNALLLMNDAELTDWYNKFRTEVDRYIDRTYASWTREDRNILRNNLYWDFWLDIQNQLNALDQKWHGDIRILQRAINNEPLSMEALQPRRAR
jgi:hypothetical protein